MKTGDDVYYMGVETFIEQIDNKTGECKIKNILFDNDDYYCMELSGMPYWDWVHITELTPVESDWPAY